MLTKKNTSKTRMAKYAAVVLALVAVLALCLASCASAAPTGAEYVTGSAAKTVYNQGEAFDCTGAQIKVTYDNGAVETKDVTKEMVGDAPLTLGMTSVSVTYSENGATVIVNIPVTVNDPYAADKKAAVDAINANADVIANSTDKGVIAFVQEYTAKINAATDKAAIDLVAGQFVEKLGEHLDAKAALIEELTGVSLEALYSQYAYRAESAREVATDGIKAAATIDEAKAILATYKTTVAKLIDEQKVFEGELDKDDIQGTVGGLIKDKIGYQVEIKNYLALVAEYMDKLYVAKLANEITPAQYVKTNDIYIDAQDDLNWWYEYVTLAENLDGVWAKIEADIIAKLRTPIDDIADKLAAGFEVVPQAYLKDEAGVVTDGADVTADLLKEIEAKINASEELYGKTMTEWFLKEYGKYNYDFTKELLGVTWTQDANNANEYDATITGGTILAKYNDLTAKRNDAAKADGVNVKIDAAIAKTNANTLKAAWDALDAWATSNGTMAIVDGVLTYEKVCDSKFTVTLEDGKYWKADGVWSNVSFTDTYIVTYFVPKLNELVAAQEKYDEALEGFGIDYEKIGKVLLSYTNADVDKGAEIKVAEDNIAAYTDKNGSDDAIDAIVAKVAEKRAEYTKLQEAAKAANDAIVALKALRENATDVVLSDYYAAQNDSEVDGKLLNAYKLYKAFAAMNKDDEGVMYTDVIEYSSYTDAENNELSGNETYLKDAMMHYITIAYALQRYDLSKAIINEAWIARRANISDDQTAFRNELALYATKAVDIINTDAKYDLKTIFTGDSVEDIKLQLNNFNYDEVLAANMEIIKAAAQAEADKISGVQFENGALKFAE